MNAKTTGRYHRENHVLRTIGLVTGLLLAIASGGIPSEAAADGSKVETENYVVEIKDPGTCKVGQECEIEIALQTRGAFRIDDKFPIKFKPESQAQGVTYTKTVVKQKDGTFGEKEGTLPVGFTIAEPGKAEVSGSFSFGVSNGTNLQVVKLNLSLGIDAK